MTAPPPVQESGLYTAGKWLGGEGRASRPVHSPYDGTLLATVYDATPNDVSAAVATAASAAEDSPLTPSRRYEVLARTSESVAERRDEFASLIVAEAGKPPRDARGEVDRAVLTLRLRAEEAKRIAGEMIPFDATPGSEHRIGFRKQCRWRSRALRRPCRTSSRRVLAQTPPRTRAASSDCRPQPSQNRSTPPCTSLSGWRLINEGSNFRVDQMPFGGVKHSGTGREGVRYTIEELTHSRLVALTLKRPT